ncbi:MAG TPA: signal peptidase I [Bacillota bacterium]|nr:signal peptidase I [Bacillota bacterium]HOL10083.1 signal peptidase I [Bacillota bacterium]HPO98741.1 signal peptidase I [Bacillota bacterium]
MIEIKKSEYRENVEAFAIAVVTILFVIIFVVQSFLVRGSSMEPTLLDGERLLVNKFIFKIREPKIGDIIVLKYPKDPTKKFIKRVIAVPNDTVQIRDGVVYVNGEAINEPYIKEKPELDFDWVNVPERTVFVMGDNRNGSKDSRDPDVGFIPYENIVGKAIFIFWPVPKVQVLFNPKYPELNDGFRQVMDY